MAKEGRGLKFETPLYKRDRDRLRAQVARLEATIAAKDAALLGIERGEGAFYGVFSRRPSARAVNTIENMKGIARAALSSDAGKGWLPPEVRERFVADMAPLVGLLKCSWAEGEMPKPVRDGIARAEATLDALKGVE